MLIGWHFINQLKGETYTYFITVFRLGKKSIVIAFSPTEPMTMAVESHSWNQNQVDLLIISERISLWFHDAKGAMPYVCIVCIAAYFHRVVIHYDGQK